MKATKIKMKYGCSNSKSVLEIEKIYITGCSNEGYFDKESLYDHLIANPDTIQVNIYPYPNLKPAKRGNEKYVRSEANDTENDNLLKLPRE